MRISIILLISFFLLPLHVHAHPEYIERLKLLDKQIEESPKNLDLQLKRITLFIDHKEYTLAASALEQFSPKDENSQLNALLLRSRLNYYEGHNKEAKALVDTYLNKQLLDCSALLLRARINKNLKNYLNAIEDYDIIIKSSETLTPEIFIEKASIYDFLPDTYKPNKAKSLEEGIDKLGPLVVLVLPIIDLYKELGQLENAQFYSKMLPSSKAH